MVEVRQSTVIDAPIEDVWRVLRDFNGHDRWHPAIATSAIEAGAPVDMVGAVRRFRLADGGELREQLLSLSDDKHTLTYCLLEAPLPLMGYVATIRLKPVTDGDRTFWEWRSAFRPPEHRREELTALVRDGVYRAGFEAIRSMFGGRPRRDTADRPPCRRLPARSRAAGFHCRRAAVGCDDAGHRRRALWRAGSAGIQGDRAAGSSAGRGADPPYGDRRQLHRRLLPHRLFRPAQAAGRAGHGGGRHRRGIGTGRRLFAGRPRRLCLPAGRRLCRAPRHVGRAAGAAARRYRRRDGGGRAAQGRLGELPAA